MDKMRDEYFSKTDSLCLKGIAITIMMFFHCFCNVERFEDYTVIFSPFSQNFIVKLTSSFNICVSIFAFITGYGLYLSARGRCSASKSIKKWAVDRYIKTFSGYWFIYILSFIITYIYKNYPHQVYLKKGFTRGVFYILTDFLGFSDVIGTPTLCGTWWYMSAALIFIVLVPIIIKISKEIGYIPIIVNIVVLPRVLDIGYLTGTNPYSFLLALIAGMIFAQFNAFEKLLNIKLIRNNKIDNIIQFVLWTVLLTASLYIWIRIQKSKFWEYHYALQPLISIFYCRKYIIRIPVINKILEFLGRHSMNIFLVHTFFRYVFFSEFIYGFKYFWLIVLVLLGVSLCVSILIELLKKVIHYDELISKLSKKITNI